MTAAQIYRLHQCISRARSAFDLAIRRLDAIGDGGEEDELLAEIDPDVSALVEAEDALFEAYVDAVRRESSAA